MTQLGRVPQVERPRSMGFSPALGASVGMLALTLLEGCGGSAASANPTPHSTVAANQTSSTDSWPEDLTLTGEVNAHATATVPNAGGVLSTCSGKRSKAGGSFTLTLSLETDHGVWQLDVTVFSYQGPGTYVAKPDATILKVNLVNTARTAAWTSNPGDPLILVVDATEDRGTISANLSNRNHESAETTETIRGNWTCRTSV